MNVAALVSRALSALRRIRRASALLRAGIAVSAALALFATTLPGWDAPDVYVAVAVIAAVACVPAPDSPAPMVLVFAVAACWLARGPSGVSPAVVVTALGLLGVHVATALAASFPATAEVEPEVLRRWATGGGLVMIVVLGAAAVGAALERWSRPGSMLVTVLALAAVAVLAWWWSQRSDGHGQTTER